MPDTIINIVSARLVFSPDDLLICKLEAGGGEAAEQSGDRFQRPQIRIGPPRGTSKNLVRTWAELAHLLLSTSISLPISAFLSIYSPSEPETPSN
jgi:hypothetical protein